MPIYTWSNLEAGFGKPVGASVNGGAFITSEILIRKDNKYFALRRPNGIPGHVLTDAEKADSDKRLYFCHDFVKYGETKEDFVRRIVKEQAGVNVLSFKLVDTDFELRTLKENNKTVEQYVILPYIIADIDSSPKKSNLISEVVSFTKDNPPKDLSWWSKEELISFLEEYH